MTTVESTYQGTKTDSTTAFMPHMPVIVVCNAKEWTVAKQRLRRMSSSFISTATSVTSTSTVVQSSLSSSSTAATATATTGVESSSLLTLLENLQLQGRIVEPQWVYDCISNWSIINTHDYKI